MIYYLLTFLSSASTVSQSTFTKLSSARGKDSVVGFNFFKCVAAFFLFLVLSIGTLQLHAPTALYGLVYGISLLASMLFGFFALAKGSMAITSLICSYSIVIPCVFGIVWLKETVEWCQYVGLALLVLSMFLLRKKDAELRLEKGWGICVTITFVCNGICSVIQKLHQVAYPGEYCREFSLFATLFMTVVLFVAFLVKKEKATGSNIKFALPAGVFMGISNYLSLILASKVNATVLFPMITVFTIILNCLVSKVFFKDKFSVAHILGIIIGAFSVILIK